MSFSELETEALDSDVPALSNLLSIAWANVPAFVPDADVDAYALRSLRELLANHDVDCDADSEKWLAAHHVLAA